jgi:O-antigen ligase
MSSSDPTGRRERGGNAVRATVAGDRIAYWLVAASLGLVQFNLLAAQVLFGLAAFAWAGIALRDGRRPEVPAFFWPLAAYGGLTLASAAASIDHLASLIDCKQLVLFLMVPMVARLARGDRAMRTIDVIVAIGAAGALIGVVEYLVLGYDELTHRPTGPLSHYMTYSGVIMLAIAAVSARLLFHTGPTVWPAIALPALLVALVGTQARNAWIGTLVAVTGLLIVRNWRLILIVPVVVALFFVAAPAGIKNRALSIFDPADPTNRDRVAMLKMGAAMVRDHPVFGVGPEMVERVYTRYRPPEAVNPTNPHLHNVPVQIAAERGLPALLAWLWFVIVATRDLARQLARGPNRAVAAAGLASVAAMLTAGLFEYNFGDSEFLMLFLGLVTLPYAAARSRDAGA